MIIGFFRIKNPRRNKEPVVGTDTKQSATDPQKLQYRLSAGVMDEDVGGNLAKVPEEVQELRKNVL